MKNDKKKINENKKICRKLRREGKSLGVIAKEIGLSKSAIAYHIKGIKVETTIKLSNNRYLCPLEKDVIVFTPSDDFAYLFGLYLGDGSIDNKMFQLTCGTIHHEHLVLKWKKAMEKICQREASVLKRKNSKCVDIRIYDKWSALKMGVKSGKKTHTCKIPEWVFEKKSYMKNCLLGLMESDGGIYHIYRRGGWWWEGRYASVSKDLLDGIEVICEKLNIKINFRKGVYIKFGSEATKKMIDLIKIDKKIEYVYN
jgi:biotin operon repressor